MNGRNRTYFKIQAKRRYFISYSSISKPILIYRKIILTVVIVTHSLFTVRLCWHFCVILELQLPHSCPSTQLYTLLRLIRVL